MPADYERLKTLCNMYEAEWYCVQHITTQWTHRMWITVSIISQNTVSHQGSQNCACVGHTYMLNETTYECTCHIIVYLHYEQKHNNTIEYTLIMHDACVIHSWIVNDAI